MHGNGLGRLKGLGALTQLKSLVISFNDLTRLDDVAYMSQLEFIDASFNKINSLEGMRVRNHTIFCDSHIALLDDSKRNKTEVFNLLRFV